MSEFIFSLSDNAAARIVALASRELEKNTGLRIAVSGGGCSGFKYEYSMTGNIEADDHVISKNGATIAIDPSSQQFLNGCSLDYVETLGSASFEIKNPNTSAKCGCGNSFSI